MKEIRRSGERGHADHGWLQSRHSFSFADYQDPEHVHFGPLRVINEDRVAPGAGFGTHGHRDMEIVSYVLEGALAHQDSTGSSSVIRPGDVQRMSAGSGVRHSEFNASKTEPVHFLQIWIIPDTVGIAPSYEEKHFSVQDRRGRLCLVASPDQADGSVLLHQDARVYAGNFDAAEHTTFTLRDGPAVLRTCRARRAARGRPAPGGGRRTQDQRCRRHRNPRGQGRRSAGFRPSGLTGC